MNFLKLLFGGKEENPEEKKKEEEKKNFDVLKYDGVAAMRTGNSDYAVRCFQHALKIQDDLEIRDYLSQVLISVNELLPAFEQLQKLAEAQPDNQQIFIRMAKVAYMMEDYSAMADACEKALLIDNTNPEVMFLYARASLGQDDDTNAVAMLTKAIMLDENYGDAYLLRAETLLSTGDIEGADEDCMFLLEKTEDSEEVMILKARIESKKGNREESLKYYDKVIDINPFSISAFRERGIIKAETGDNEGAAEDERQAVELESKDDEASDKDGDSANIEENMNRKYRENNPYGF